MVTSEGFGVLVALSLAGAVVSLLGALSPKEARPREIDGWLTPGA